MGQSAGLCHLPVVDHADTPWQRPQGDHPRLVFYLTGGAALEDWRGKTYTKELQKSNTFEVANASPKDMYCMHEIYLILT